MVVSETKPRTEIKIMKHKITITETESEKLNLTLMGELGHTHVPQFRTRPVPELPSRVFAKATGQKARWYDVSHFSNRTVLTAQY